MSSYSFVQPLSASLPTEEIAIYPASLAQQRLWFLNQLQGPTAAYNVHVGLWLYGPLNISALQASLQEVVNRHESLRTTFSLKNGELVQRVKAIYKVCVPVTDFADLERPHPRAYECAKREVEEPFDLGKGPLFRARIMRLAPEEHVFLCTMHHTITDAWSMQVFAKELAVFYEALTSGKPAALPELPIQYGDYSEWQRRWIETESAQKQLAYWKHALQDAPAVLELPKDGPRPAEQTLQGATQTFAVPAEIIAGVASLAKRRRVTPFMVLLAAFKALLYRYSGEPDVLVGVPVASRTQVETEALIGFFVDTLVLRDDLSSNPRFLELLSQVRETTLGAMANADIPFEKVVEALRPERSLRYNPIFQVMFSVIKSAIRSHDFGNIVTYPYVVNASTSILDLCATFIEDSDSKWWLQVDFDTGLFKAERIARTFEHYMELLRQIISNPETHIDDLSLPGVPQTASCVKSSRRSGHDNSKLDAQTASAGRPKGQPALPLADEQELLVEVWKNVLGLKEVSIHDNFFDVGGHSLLAARLISQLQEVTGRTIPVSAIFRAPTIAGLASLLRDEAFSGGDPFVMQLHRGDSAVPFFAVAAPGVDSFGFALLARHIGEHESLYKIQGPGPAVWDRPFEQDELRAMAQQYIAAMRAVQPHGPFCLGGMCDGVHIAQEMIFQLESQGEEVALFTIFDTWVLENSQVRLLWFVDYYLQRIRNFPRLPLSEKRATVQRVFKRLAGRNGSGKTVWTQTYWPGPDFRARQFRTPVLLFKRPRQPYFHVRDPEMGWGARSTGGVTICEVNCGHVEFLRQPYVHLVGQKLSQRLREINARVKEGTVPVSGLHIGSSNGKWQPSTSQPPLAQGNGNR
jgi:thioesterase domain-containing protein